MFLLQQVCVYEKQILRYIDIHCYGFEELTEGHPLRRPMNMEKDDSSRREVHQDPREVGTVFLKFLPERDVNRLLCISRRSISSRIHDLYAQKQKSENGMHANQKRQRLLCFKYICVLEKVKKTSIK